MPMFKHVCSIRLLQSLQHTVTSALQLYCKHYYNTSMSDHALAHIGRRHYVSISGLSHVLKEIKAHFNEHGILPESDSRQSIKRAREQDMSQYNHHKYGDLIQSFTMQMQKGPDREFLYVDPMTLMHALIEHKPIFRKLIAEQLMRHVPSPSKPLGIIYYGDEVTPGDSLQKVNKRKIECIYWTFAELGPLCHTKEFLWFPLTVHRSMFCHNVVGGTTAWSAKNLEIFYKQGSNFLVDAFQHSSYIIFATVTNIVADENALKEIYGVKGHGGLLCCGTCQNVVGKRTLLDAHRPSLVSVVCCDPTKFNVHTSTTFRGAAKRLLMKSAVLNKGQFGQEEMAAGLNLVPNGVLLSSTLERFAFDPATSWMYDI